MKKDKPIPPKLFLRFFRWYCHPKLMKHIEGDLMELYNERLKGKSKRKADMKFIIDVLLLFRPGIVKRPGGFNDANSYDMLASHTKIAWRIIQREKGYSFINIAGLAVGLASAILIMLWVQNEISYDRFHSKSDRICKMFSRDEFNGRTDVWQTTPALLAPELRQSYEDVEEVTRYRDVFFLVKSQEERFNEQGAFVDPAYLTMFDFPMHKGKQDALKNDFGIVLGEPLAIKLFGTIDCVGKTVVVNDNDNFTITGVLKALPHNTEFQFQFLLPWNYVSRLGWDAYGDWAQTDVITLALLKEKSSFQEFQSKVLKIVQHYIKEGDGSTREVLVHPLAKAHLYSRAENGELTTGRIDTVRMFSAIAVLIILIACINFMNLSTARSEKRSREVGVRKIVGAQKGSLVMQFLTESIILVSIAFVVALGLVQLSLGTFNTVVDAPLSINFDNPRYWLVAITLVLFTGLLAGSYPAFYLSSSRPLKVLKGAFKTARAPITPREALVVVQFTFAMVLSIFAAMVQRQIQYAIEREDGYNRQGIAYNFTQGDVPKNFNAIRSELISSGAAVSVTRTFSPVVGIWNVHNGYSWQGSTEADSRINFLQFGSDMDFKETFGAEFKLGRDIDIYTHPSDTSALLLNEAAVEVMQLQDPIGAIIRYENGQTFHVVGVVKNFIVGSPYQDVNPMMIKGWTDRYGVVNFRLNSSRSQTEALSKAEQIFRKYNPEYPFEYFFVDEFYNRKFGREKQTGTLAGLFAGLAIFISCLGLFGLAAYMAESKTKEIGIRKVLGASVISITTLMSKEFVKLVVFSTIIASPVAFYAVSDWLQSFSYRVPIGISIFLITAGTTVTISVLTVSVQSIRAAMANPVDSLRSE